MKSLRTYINEKLIIKQKQTLTPANKHKLTTAILDHFKSHDGDLNDIDVSKLKEEDFYRLFLDLRDEISKNNITEIDISDWELKELHCFNNTGMFDNCMTLETIILPDCLEVIDKFTFYYCNNLHNIIIPNSVIKIGEYAFGSCFSLTSVTIGNSVISIGDVAFDGCRYLESIIIPDSVQSIGNGAFYGCNKLTITVSNERVKKLVEDGGFYGEIIINK